MGTDGGDTNHQEYLLGLATYILELTLELLSSLCYGHLIPQNHLTRVQTHHQQMLRPLQQLSRQDQDQVGRIPHLTLLRFGSHDEQLGSGVNDFDFPDDGRCVRGDEEFSKVVDDELIPSCNSSKYCHSNIEHV